MRRDGAYPSVIVKNNIDVNIQGAASGAAPAPQPAASGASYGGINVGVNVDDSISYGGENIDVDTHIEVDVNGNECEVNSSGVTVKTKINGVWYDSNSLPSSSTNNYIPSPSAAPDNHYQRPAPAPASSQPAHQPWKQNDGASYHPRPTSSSSSTTSTTSSSTTPAYHHTPPTHTPTNTPYFISGEGVMGISWDQFTLPDQACKTESEITDDINQLVSYGYQNIRLYGPECNAIDYALSALNGTGTNLIVGLFSVTNYTNECSDMISQVNGRWDLVEYVSVFNEAVNDGLATISDVETAIAYVKAHIPDNTVPVTTIDTFSAFIANPDLCNVGADFIACNCQPYFSAVAASDAGAYVLQQQQKVAQICNVNSVDITGFTLI